MSKARDIADGKTSGGGGFKNVIINGAMQVAQRGDVTGVTNSIFGGPDRMRTLFSVTSYTSDVAQEEDGPDGFRYSYKWTTSAVRTGSTADEYTGVFMPMEVRDVFNLLWSNNTHMTFSFWVKSSITGDFAFNCNAGETNSGGSAKRILYHSIYTINTANTWERKTVTIPLSFLSSYALDAGTSDSARGMEITWVLDVSSGGSRSSASVGWNNPSTEARNAVTSAAGADTGIFSTLNATWQITGIQLEAGEDATDFEHRSYGDELARCQRYYQRYIGGNTGIMNHHARTTTAKYGVIHHPVQFRVTPTLGYSSMSDFKAYVAGTSSTPTSITRQGSTLHSTEMYIVTPSNGSAGQAGWLRLVSASGYLDFDAEL